MTSKGPLYSPPRAVAAHRSREEGDRQLEPRHRFPSHHQEQQLRTGRRDGRDARSDLTDENYRDDRDARQGRDYRSERDKNDDRSRNAGGSKTGDQNQIQGSGERSRSRDQCGTESQRLSRRDRRQRERERDRERKTDRSEATGTGLDVAASEDERGRHRDSFRNSHTGPPEKIERAGKRPFSPEPSFDPTSSGGGKRARQDSSPYRHSHHKGQSSRSPPPQLASSSRRERHSRHRTRERADTIESSGAGVSAIGGSPRRRDEDPEQSRRRERDRERERDRDRERHRDRERSANQEHNRDRDYRHERDQDRDRDRERERHRDGERDREVNRHRERDRERDRGRHRDRERDRGRGRGREKERERESDRDRHGRSPRSSRKTERQRKSPHASHASGTVVGSPKTPVDDDMATRSGSYRIGAGHGPQGNGEDSTQQQYHQTQHTQHDPPRYSRQQQHSHSHHPPQSEHATPNTSYQGSQSYQSPYGGSQGWDTGHQQYSPQGQYSQQAQNPPYSNRSPIGTPHGPAAYHQANSPPYGAPLGPGGQYGNLRGSQHGPGRGGHRHSAGNGANGSYHGQDASLEGDHRASPMSVSPQMGSHQHNRNNRHGSHHPPHSQGPNSYTQSSERYSDKQRQHAADDGQSLRSERGRQESRHSAADDQMLPPSKRQPPTGPQSKFSFAFKNVSKPLVAVPKTEIAQKLSSVVQSQQQQQQQQDALPPPAQPSEIAKSGFPVGAPTEPASIRARSEQQRQRAEASSQQMRGGAYYHKVKQIVRRPKARPTLPDDFAASESVYYRKPGNESVVGAGTYGKVFKAVHVYTKRLVALKRIRMDGEREGLPVTAIREIKLLQSLRHSNVVDLLEVMVEGNNCFMVFEYLSHDLNGLLNHPTFKMNAAQKKHMALQLFQGLDYLHRRGVLHRDIKAANILVSNTGVLKLADFGLARFFAKHHKLDYSNRVVTIWYRSPELLLGETRYGPAVDIWSAACVLGEIFTHKPVFPCNGGEIGQINKIYSILGTPSKHDWPELTDMPWFELLRPEMKMPNVFAEKYQKVLSPAAFDVLRSMFHYDPAKRPTAEQVLEHPYFTQEEPAPRQAVELAEIGGEWHEFESKALRRQTENAKKAGDARKTILPATSVAAGNEPIETGREDKKRPAGVETDRAKTDVAVQRDAKRQHTETLQDRPQSPPPASARAASSVVSTMTDAAVAKIDTAQKGDKAAATEVAAISPPPPPEPELGQPVHLTGTVQQ